MKRFLLPAIAVAVLGGSAKAENPSTATAWTCTSQTSGRAEYVIEGNELKKRDDDLQRYEACRRNHPAPTPGPDGKVNADSFLTDPCEPLDLQNYTFQIVLNNQIGLVAVSPETGIRDDASIWVSGRTIVIDKLTGNYVETLLSTPTLPLSPEAKETKTRRCRHLCCRIWRDLRRDATRGPEVGRWCAGWLPQPGSGGEGGEKADEEERHA